MILGTCLKDVDLIAVEVVDAAEFEEECGWGLLCERDFLPVVIPIGHGDPEADERESGEEHESAAAHGEGVIHVVCQSPKAVCGGKDHASVSYRCKAGGGGAGATGFDVWDIDCDM